MSSEKTAAVAALTATSADNKSGDDIGRSPSVAPSTNAGKVIDTDVENEKLYYMGYDQHMKRGFNFWSMTAFCLTGLGLLPSLGGRPDPPVVTAGLS